ncbi:transposase [Shinella curvata]|uniref:Transposase n=1 Tax=Shinella curvata TaxID=1817964 RepID=A0ABT8XH01_9HYPH|nr:helix-turn-helix domain-containing protein [Shinella curvata]MCJ8053328.1 transposase [Shinella curvata]MDO6122659.1 transposase [Shinella curvata]
MHQFIVSQRRASRNCRSAAPETKGAGGGQEGARRAAADPDGPTVPPGVACRIVRQLVLEMTAMASERPLWRRDGRRSTCHVRQIAMYVCHVILQLSLSDIGAAFGRDRTTVGHACNVVEDRRDDASFDAFVASIERVVLSVFGPAGIGSHG